MQKKYPPFTIRKLLETDLISSQTKKVLIDRLKQLEEQYEPAYFTPYLFSILRAVSDRLIPQEKNDACIDLAASIDRRLKEGKNDGWRYASMPPDGEAYQAGLTGIDEMAKAHLNKKFTELEQHQQDDILSAVQHGNIIGAAWKSISPQHFFEDLMAEFTEAYYSHPLAQEQIGFVGMADMQGWKLLGLNEHEKPEPETTINISEG
jgi:gluconate 2-dehydrogenase gamma chain